MFSYSSIFFRLSGVAFLVIITYNRNYVLRQSYMLLHVLCTTPSMPINTRISNSTSSSFLRRLFAENSYDSTYLLFHTKKIGRKRQIQFINKCLRCKNLATFLPPIGTILLGTKKLFFLGTNNVLD